MSTLRDKICNIIFGGYEIDGLKRKPYVCDFIDGTYVQKVLNDNACDFIINKLVDEMENPNTVIIPGGGFNNRDSKNIDFLDQNFYNEETLNNFLNEGTNYIIIDPEFSKTNDIENITNIDKYRDLKDAVSLIKRYLLQVSDDSKEEKIPNKILAEQFIYTNLNGGVVYEISVQRKECLSNKIYLVGSNFYFSNCIHNFLEKYPDTLKKNSSKLEASKIPLYNENILELKTLYFNKLNKFKELIDKSKNFFIFNCIRFKFMMDEYIHYSIDSNIKKFLIDNSLTEKVNYFVLKYGREGDNYNYFYIYPQYIVNKLKKMNEEENYEYYNLTETLNDESYGDKYYLINRKKFYLYLYPDMNYLIEGGNNKYYKKYMKYKIKYLKLSKKLKL